MDRVSVLPIHCGQSSAETRLVANTIASREKLRVIGQPEKGSGACARATAFKRAQCDAVRQHDSTAFAVTSRWTRRFLPRLASLAGTKSVHAGGSRSQHRICGPSSANTPYFDCPILFVVPPLGGNLACQTMNIQPIFRLKPGLQANLGQSNYAGRPTSANLSRPHAAPLTTLPAAVQSTPVRLKFGPVHHEYQHWRGPRLT